MRIILHIRNFTRSIW